MNKIKINHKKILFQRSAIILFFGASLLIAGFLVFFPIQDKPASYVSYAKNLETTGTTSVSVIKGTGSSLIIPAQPDRLVIPVIGVDATIEGVGLSKNGSGDMGIPTKVMDVAWYNQGITPGMPGSAVIAGHLNGKVIGSTKGTFYDLNKLKVGDLVEIVDKQGKTLKFKVAGSQTYNYNASAGEVFLSDTTKARLNLITCAGDWVQSKKIYNKRLVVFTELIKNE